jgi:hypothetical protein
MSTRTTRALPWLALSGVVTMLAAGLALLLPVTATGQPASSAQTITRQMDKKYNYNVPETTVYNASVTVSQTKDLVRQKVKVSWSGLRPTNGSIGAANYPVVVMQCWGNKDQVTQQTCWNGGSNVGTSSLGVTFADVGPFDPAVFGTAPSRDSVLPFKARDDGRLYNGWTGFTGWPEDQIIKSSPTAHSVATANAILPNSYQGYTNPDGTGETDIELFTGFENPHLGCSSTAACSLVVIPIGDPVCKPDSELPSTIRGQCRAGRVTGRLAAHWMSPTNWSRKFAFDLSFRESPNACKIGSQPETGLSGSFYAFQLLNNSWRPKFCQDKKLFPLSYTALSDGEARAQFGGALTGPWRDGSTNALLSSRAVEGELAKPTVYAPVTVSGVAVSFVLDDNNRKEVTELNLNARLLAKMITQSYRSMSPAGLSHPGVRNNPEWWGSDPELLALNPALADALYATGREGANYPVVSLGDLDSIYALTAYIAADKDAVAWLNGASDGHGMFVNPKYHRYELPVGLLEQRDDFKDTNTNSAIYGQILLSAWSNVADNIYNAAISIAQAWPYASLSQDCVVQGEPETCSLKRIGQRQVGGFRAMLAITSLADSKVFGLRQAALQTSPGKFVKPDDDSLALALRGTKLDEKTGVLNPDLPKMHPNAYPGMSVVYAAIPTTGLSAVSAGNYAKFLDYAAGPGQVQGLAAGQLPDGYVPLSDPLREQTRNAAVAVREQKGQVPAPPPGLTDDPAAGLLPPAGSGGTNNLTGGGASQPAASTPGTTTPVPSASGTAPPTVDKAATSIATRTDASGFAKWVLPGLLGLGALAGLIAFGAMVWTQPQHPVRRALRAALRRS